MTYQFNRESFKAQEFKGRFERLPEGEEELLATELELALGLPEREYAQVNRSQSGQHPLVTEHLE
jgi:hypothetical protein